MTQDDFGNTETSRLELLADVAERYYIDGYGQNEIAAEFSLSRSNVSRLLTEARRVGIVEIRVHRPLGREDALERELQAVLGLAEARVLALPGVVGAEEALGRLGALASRLLMERLHDGLAIGLSWGMALEAMVRACSVSRSYDVEVVQVIGAVSSGSAAVSSHELGRQLANRLGGRFTGLHTLAVLASEAVAAGMLKEPAIERVLDRARSVQLAFVGIGALHVGSSQDLLAAADLSADEQRLLRTRGAVGEICARLFDIEGCPVAIPFDGRVAAVTLEELRSIPEVVGVAFGREKAGAIRGAARGGLVDVLVTDERTARSVLRMDRDLRGV
jgi:DNA-binding transcriptional regulator LsrR (DeoR family)